MTGTVTRPSSRGSVAPAERSSCARLPAAARSRCAPRTRGSNGGIRAGAARSRPQSSNRRSLASRASTLSIATSCGPGSGGCSSSASAGQPGKAGSSVDRHGAEPVAPFHRASSSSGRRSLTKAFPSWPGDAAPRRPYRSLGECIWPAPLLPQDLLHRFTLRQLVDQLVQIANLAHGRLLDVFDSDAANHTLDQSARRIRARSSGEKGLEIGSLLDLRLELLLA